MNKNPARHVAISLEMEWAYKQHLEVFAGCQKYADEMGWNCQIHPAVDRTPISESGTSFDGIIARATPAIAEYAEKTKTPLMNVWLNSQVKNLPGVFPDYNRSGEMGAEHLLSRGFSNFGYMGCQTDINARQQYDGFRATLAEHGYRCSAQLYSRSRLTGTAPGWEEFVSSIKDWMKNWQLPIGILVSSDLHARYLVDICRSNNLKVSEDVAVIGTGNETSICESPPSTLTSIDMGFAQVGYQAAARLERLMNGESLAESTILISPSDIVPRQSTDLYACNDPIVSQALHFIAENCQRNINVSDVVRGVTTNRRGLERRFKQALGKSISGEIARLRLERAKHHLAQTNSTIKEVAAAAGFRDADHFYKVFNRIEGIPPSQYRETHQQLFTKDSQR
ncbi:substrate-binding domain-containing protein [Rubritalea profundi]|uniref:HTH araC/xylS-type domain-containing protein n=1 Tax=Rubritalea profundi TaxID=1658618 RepID=A0A2S7U4I6_9BACT|nr:substrate-binding domain-containing protein [Rubritalea profundi]PQJ29427.1 hypothetical protein BSZ32_13650 [Rubritalea profundi]